MGGGQHVTGRLLAHRAQRRTARARADAIVVAFVDLVALVVAGVAARGGVHEAALLVGFACVLAVTGDYAYRLTPSALEEVPRLLTRLAVVAAPVALLAGDGASLVLRVAAVAAGLLLVGRCVSYAMVRRSRRRRAGIVTIVLGAGPVGREVLAILEQHPEYGLRGLGIVDDTSPGEWVPTIGRVEDLERLCVQHGVGCLIVAFGPTRSAALLPMLRKAAAGSLDVYLVPRFFELGVVYRGAAAEDLWGVPLVRLRPSANRTWTWPMKRATDVVVASAMLVLSIPLMLMSAVLVRLSSPGPILFRQQRVGRRGKLVSILKFRTLPVDLVDQQWNTPYQEYVSPISRFLRRACLDELPQLFNVLRGDMSLVGPRPERGYLVERFNDTVDGYRDRHRLPVGLTGWAQVHGLRGDTSLHDRARFDNQYIERWSFWRDIVIMVRTAAAVLRSGPAAAPRTTESPGDAELRPSGSVSESAGETPIGRAARRASSA